MPDYQGNTIRKITSAGVVTTLAGTGSAGNTNGQDNLVSFKTPFGLASDVNGNLYIGDQGNNLIRKITPYSNASLLWSNGATTATLKVKDSGNYTVAGIAAGGCSANSAATAVTVNIVTPPTVSPSGSVIMCVGDSVTLTASAASGYYWSTGATTQSIKVKSSGTYSVKNVLAGCTSLPSNVVTVNTSLQPGVPTISARSLSGCSADSVTITATPNNLMTGSVFAGTGTQGSQNGPASQASFSNTTGIATDLAGNIYLCEAAKIRKITPDGTVSTLAGSGYQGNVNGNGTNASFGILSGLAIDKYGNIFVADFYNHQIRKITPAGQVTTFAGQGFPAGLVDGQASTARFNGPSAVAVDSNGVVYVCDEGNNAIRKIDTSGNVSTLAGGSLGYADGQGSAAKFNTPSYMTIDKAGNIYVSDQNNNRIRKVTPTGLVSTFAGGNGNPNNNNIGVADGNGTNAGLAYPRSITINPSGSLFFVDGGSYKIRKISSSGDVTTISNRISGLSAIMYGLDNNIYEGNFITYQVTKYPVFASTTSYLWNTGETGSSIKAKVSGKYSVKAVSASGCQSASSDSLNFNISPTPAAPTITASGSTSFCSGGSVTLTSSAVSNNIWSNGANTRSITVSASGTFTVKSFQGSCTSALSNPTVVTVTELPDTLKLSSVGTVNICGSDSLVLTTLPGAVSTVGTYCGSRTLGSQDGLGSSAQFALPNDIVFDQQGNAYISDQGNQVIRKVSSSGYTSTFAGLVGSRGSVNGTGSSARFNFPFGLCMDKAGNLYVADYSNHQIRKITPVGQVSTFAGSSGGYKDGPASQAQFKQPNDIAVDKAGNMYVTDYGNSIVRKIDASGNVSTLAGGGPGTAVDGTGTAASFGSLGGIAVDSVGNVYVADLNKIRKITPSGVVSTFAGKDSYGYANGNASNALFWTIGHLVFDTSGNLFAADCGNNVIRKISNGVVTTYAGKQYLGYPQLPYMDGTGNNATFDYPIGLGVSPDGDLYTTERNAIRRIKALPAAVSYLWNNGAATPSVTVKGAGTFSVRGISATGCTSAASMVTTVNATSKPQKPVISSSNGFTLCPQLQSLLLTANSPDISLNKKFIWSDGYTSSSPTYSLQAGNTPNNGKTLTVKVVINGCTSLASEPVVITKLITVPPAPNITYSTPSLSLCQGDSVVFTSDNPNTTWQSTPNRSFYKLGSWVTVKSSENIYAFIAYSGICNSASTNPINVTFGNPGVPTVTTNGPTTLCGGNTLSLTASGAGIGYIWNDGVTSASRTITMPGTYSVRGISTFAGNSSTCTSASSTPVVVTSSLSTATITASGSTSLCAGGTVTLTASGGNTHLWNDGQTGASRVVAVAGSYTVKAIANGCTSNSSAATVVTVNPAVPTPTISTGGAPTSFCYPGSITLVASGGSQYIWSNGATGSSITVDSSSNYTVRAISNGCTSAAATSVVVVLTGPNVTVSASGPTSLCGNDSVTLTASGGNSWLWSNGKTTKSIVVKSSGSYTVRGFNSGCGGDYSAPIVVNIDSIPTAPFITGGTTLCSGSSTTLVAEGGSAWLWNDGNTDKVRVISAPGSYSVKAINKGCQSASSSTVNVVMGSALTASISSVGTTAICSGNTVTLKASGGQAYLWSDGSTDSVLITNIPGTYTVKAISDGCVSPISNPVTLTANQAPTVGLQVSGSTDLCNGASVTLTATGGTSYVWNDGSTINPRVVSTSGSYSVQAIGNGCSSAASQEVVVNAGTSASNAGSISGSSTAYPSTIGTYSVGAIANASSYHWAYSGTGVGISGSGTTVNLQFSSNATSGLLSVYGSSSCGDGASSTLPITISSGTIPDLTVNTNTPISGTYRNVTFSGGPTVTLNGNLYVTGNIVVPNGVTLVTGCNQINGNSFTLEAGGTLKVCDAQGIAQSAAKGAIRTGTRNYSDDANYEYNGTSAQVTGDGLPAKVRNLNINNTAGVKLVNSSSVSGTLTISNGTFDLDNQSFTLLSSKTGTASLAEVPSGSGLSNASNFTVQRWLDSAAVRRETAGFGAYYWLGASVTGKTVDLWNTATNPYVATSYDGLSHHGSIWLYNNQDNTTPAYGGWVKPTTSSTPLNPGTGARVWFNNSFFASGATATATESPLTGNVSLPVSYCTGNCAGNLSTNGWNLVSNPYPSAIDWDNANWDKINIGNAIWIWRHQQNVYSSYINGIGVNGGNNLIASGQSFMVLANAGSPSLVAKELVKSSASASVLRQAPVSLVRLQLKAGNWTDETVIADRPGSLRAFEPANDAFKFTNPALNIWSEPTTASEAQSIASIGINTGDTIALKMLSSTAQTATLKATDLSDLSSRFNLFVRDELTHTIQPLIAGSSLNFVLTANRVYPITILFKPLNVTGLSSKVSVNLDIMPNPNNGSFTISSSSELKAITLFDNLGRIVATETLSGNTGSLELKLPAGVYSARITHQDGFAIRKIVIE